MPLAVLGRQRMHYARRSDSMWTGGNAVSNDDRAVVEQHIAEAGLRPYQAMVVRRIAQDENVTAALNWIMQMKEVSDGDR